MPDAGEVKAKVIIEYNGDGIKQAKEDLASLAESAGSVGQSAEKASDGLSGLDGQLSSNAESARGFSNVLADLPKMTEAGGAGVAEMTSALVEHKSAVEEAGTAYESLQKPVGTTVSMLQEASAPMQTISKNAESMQAQVSMAGESFTQVGESLSQSIPMLPQFAESMHAVSESFDPKAFGLDDFVRNTEVFQEALSSPTPFSMMKEHILETGQTWSDFTSSLSGSDAAMFTEMVQRTSGSYPVLDKAAESAQKVGTAFTEAANGANEFTAQFNGVADSTASASKAINEFGGVGEGLYGPTQSVKEFGSAINKLGGEAGGKVGGMMKSIGIGEAFGNATEGLMGVLNDVAMPLMAVQMIGMAVQATGKAIYDSAVLVEGKAAHSYGTFTGTVDALGQSVQNLGGQFSESFGQAIMPTLNVLNAQFADQGGIAKFLGDSAGGALGILFNIGQIASGINPMGGIAGLEGAFGITSVEGPGPISANPMQSQIDQFYQQANDPQYLAAQAYYGSAMAKAQKNQAIWDTSHYAGTTGPLDPMNEILQAQAVRANGGVYGHVPEDPNLAWLNDLGNPGGGGYAEFYNGRGNGSSGNSGSFQVTPGGGAAYMNNDAGDTPQTSVMDTWFPGLREGYTNIVAPKVLNDQQMKGMQDFFSGIGSAFGNSGSFFGGIGQDFHNLWDGLFGGGGGGQSAPSTFTGGCFVAGTPVLMANGSSKAIEALRVDERVLAYDGEKQVPSTIIGCIAFPAKQTYALTFSDGNMLTTTDSHPLAGADGWKSISPESTALENPGLPVTALQVGDDIYTAAGTLCRLISILKREITTVYNITVDGAHTFYAAGILVHNKMASASIGQQASEQIGDIQLPHMDLSGMAGQLGGNFSGIQLPHMDMSGISAGLGGALSGISLPHIDMSGISGSLAGAFSGISMPPIPAIGSEISGALGGMFSGISMPAVPDIGSQLSGALGGMFSGISMPAIPDIGGSISGALSGMFGSISIPSPPQVGGMISGAMSGIFGGIQPPSPPEVGAMINGVMGGIFSGITVPSPPNVGAMISGAMSSMFSGISMPSVPFFASGVSNFSGGPAVVGEGGAPEVVGYNGGYSLFDKGAAFVNLPSGASVYPMKNLGGSSVAQFADGTGGGGFSPLSLGRGGMPQSVNVAVHLDSQMILSALQLPFAQDIRVQSGNRSY